MKKYFIFLFLLPLAATLYFYANIYTTTKKQKPLETESKIRLLFIGDIMGHHSQIKAAFHEKEKSYKYDTSFEKVTSLIKSYDFAIANFEVTLSGPPYSGYPSFSSPKSLAKAAKKAGIDVLLTANNHACDRGQRGLRRTIKALNDLDIRHTGSFAKVCDRNMSNLITLKKDDIKIGLLNYTEHTNWVPTPKGTFINRLEFKTILEDINASKSQNLDILILILHWGDEYKHHPKKEHIALAKKLFNAGVDIIVGSHSHTLHPMHYFSDDNSGKGHLIYYSLGNFVSDQRRRYSNGGALAGIVIAKNAKKTYIKSSGYHLVWVNKYEKDKHKIFEVLPVKRYEANLYYLRGYAKKNIEEFISDSRKLLYKYNKNVIEW